jgi:hypothetical protein
VSKHSLFYFLTEERERERERRRGERERERERAAIDLKDRAR